MRAHLKAYGHAQGSPGSNIGPALALDLAIPALPDRPLSVDLGRGAGSPNLSFWGLPFRSYVLQASEDLVKWDDLPGSNPGSAGAVPLVFDDAYPAQYFRMRRE